MRRSNPTSRFGGAFALVVVGTASCGGDADIEQPTALFDEVPIEYPLHMWDQDVEGQTLLRVRVTDLGAVDSVEVLETSGFVSLDSAAIAGAVNLRFTPARREGQSIAVWAEVPIHFSKRPGQDQFGGPAPPTGGS